MRLVIIESPFRAETAKLATRNMTYLNQCIADSLRRGESPYASHRMIPGALNDLIPEERDLGIRAGYAWWKVASKVVFYLDLGWSEGMKRALQRAKTMEMPWEERRIL
jgi:hypothetical protein